MIGGRAGGKKGTGTSKEKNSEFSANLKRKSRSSASVNLVTPGGLNKLCLDYKEGKAAAIKSLMLKPKLG